MGKKERFLFLFFLFGCSRLMRDGFFCLWFVVVFCLAAPASCGMFFFIYCLIFIVPVRGVFVFCFSCLLLFAGLPTSVVTPRNEESRFAQRHGFSLFVVFFCLWFVVFFCLLLSIYCSGSRRFYYLWFSCSRPMRDCRAVGVCC